ncbi:unnamed protein product [Rotaria sordida]|uniref:Uncharacterized protein n=2 Tax=Rotaria sordida TaxID=392033 RepID=A0A814VXV7_9BILA|nr:unnamed protein product [Rotaria sordida]CAF1581128.1 unnamed protein product [Rotaria sordida]
MASSSSINYDWKILGLGRGVSTAKQAEENLKALGYKNIKIDGSLENNAGGDEKLIALLKENDWDAVSLGGGLTGYDEHFQREVATLHWFNRIVNIIHEHAPKAKFIFVDKPASLVEGIHRVLDNGHK